MYEIDNIWLWYITILKYKIFYDIVSIRNIGGNMSNYKLDNKEVILYEGHGYYEEIKKDIQLVLTNKKIVIERMGGLFKKELKLVEIIPLEDIKIYKDKIQVKRQNDTVIIQTIDKNISILFDKDKNARELEKEIINAKSGTSSLDRSKSKFKKVVNFVKNNKEVVSVLASVVLTLASKNNDLDDKK